MANRSANRVEKARWNAAAAVLAQVRLHPGITRAEMARRLSLSSGSATEITARLRELRLLTEVPAPTQGRGRPTTVLGPHPRGPLVVAAEVRQEDWRCAVASLDGRLHPLRSCRHDGRRPDSVLAALRQAVERARESYPGRILAVSLAVAGTIQDGRLVQASTLGWGPVDFSGLTAGTGLPLLLGNDATLAGVAEARTGAAAGAGTALHLLVGVGVGGSLVVDGQPLQGAGGSAGEYGHLPFGNRALCCPCGARGCWDLEVDGRALARHLGDPPPDDPRNYARHILDRVHEPSARQAVTAVATALATGIAGLINVHDPDVVTLGGLAGPLRAAAGAEFQTAYIDGLMAFRRDRPPSILDAAHGDNGSLHGAAAVGLDRITSEDSLSDLAMRSNRTP